MFSHFELSDESYLIQNYKQNNYSLYTLIQNQNLEGSNGQLRVALYNKQHLLVDYYLVQPFWIWLWHTAVERVPLCEVSLCRPVGPSGGEVDNASHCKAWWDHTDSCTHIERWSQQNHRFSEIKAYSKIKINHMSHHKETLVKIL